MVKVGDAVRIIACNWGHGLEVGSIHKIDTVEGEDDYYIRDGAYYWAVGDDEIEIL